MSHIVNRRILSAAYQTAAHDNRSLPRLWSDEMLRVILEHPFWVALGTIATVLSLILANVSAIYASITDGEVCGWRNEAMTVAPINEYEACRDQSHGVDYYEYNEKVSGSSGWLGGGYNPIAWCDDVKRKKESVVGDVLWGQPEYSEENRKTGFGRAEYNYHCSIEASWGPVYRLERSEACQRAQPTIVFEKVPNRCEDKTIRVGWSIFGLSLTGWPWGVQEIPMDAK